ncbi:MULTISPECIES: DUF2303 family protein [unclassified Aeromicrobium]|uniref:DUF2303 family protein n=1 Tax=unclassified Aeromicrobium TaxID=2633570 RepID=UPI00288962D7|nr:MULTISPECIES: DUF2303 family protein [unclassified Aeromicrobium]
MSITHLDDETVASITSLAEHAAKPVEVWEGSRYAVVVPAGASLAELDLDRDEFRNHPRRKKGTVHVHDIDGFADYFARHYEPADAEVWADILQRRITGVLNGHANGAAGAAGWRDHRVVFEAKPTDPWKAWLAVDGKLIPQKEFADFLEDNAQDIRVPDAAVMLEVAQTLEGYTGVEWQSSQRTSNGERKFAYSETATARAGQTGDLVVPEKLELALRPFEGAGLYKVEARFRYRISNGQLTLGVRLDRPDEVLVHAFEDVIVALGTALPDDAQITRGSIG